MPFIGYDIAAPVAGLILLADGIAHVPVGSGMLTARWTDMAAFFSV